ncbi:MAG: hypothetical protein J6C44_10125 [Muribaculaceae bacterium]|nr:hypothetical protein [Muribaculaceae bacterium]
MEDKNNQDNKIPRAKLWLLRALSILILASIVFCFVWVYMKFDSDGIDVAIIGAIVITALYIWFLIKIGVNLWQIFTPEGRKMTKKLQEEEARKKAERNGILKKTIAESANNGLMFGMGLGAGLGVINSVIGDDCNSSDCDDNLDDYDDWDDGYDGGDDYDDNRIKKRPFIDKKD